MSLVYYKMDPTLAMYLEWANSFFSLVFNLEMFLKLISLKWEYFYSNWNIFDMIIVISADIGILMDYLGASARLTTVVIVLRAFRILRIVRLLRKFDSIRVIVATAINILPSIINIMALFLLALYIFACVGVNLFATTKPRVWIDTKFNF
jgi:hypothetical protein